MDENEIQKKAILPFGKNNSHFMYWNSVYLTLPENALTYIYILK